MRQSSLILYKFTRCKKKSGGWVGCAVQSTYNAISKILLLNVISVYYLNVEQMCIQYIMNRLYKSCCFIISNVLYIFRLCICETANGIKILIKKRFIS
jgi:hypothetical protein